MKPPRLKDMMTTLNTKILRGAEQIGGSLIEISTATTRILFDAGRELEEADPPKLPSVDGLFDSAGFDAVFFSHYHADHIGLAHFIHKDVPLYLGEKADAVLQAADFYTRNSNKRNAEKPELPKFLHYQSGKPVKVGDITVTPFMSDHSAFDSYMLLAEAGGESVLYTGDFRASGRKSFDKLLRRLPKKVDKIICEGTTLGRGEHTVVTEEDLEEKAAALFKETAGPVFVLTAATNIDRMVTFYKAAKKSNRLFLEELYAAVITEAAGEKIPNPRDFNDVRAFITTKYEPDSPLYKKLCEYEDRKIGMKSMHKKPFAMCVRASGQMRKYLKELREYVDFSGGVLVYSMWSGYKEKPDMAEFLKFCSDELGLQTVTLHTSGHADPGTIEKLIDSVNPTEVEGIHTENIEWFQKFAR